MTAASAGWAAPADSWGGPVAPDGQGSPTADVSPTAGEGCLVVENATSGTALLTRPVANGTPVVLTYTHSVEKTRVVDGYAVRGDRLRMVRMEFASYGAGLPARADVNRTDDGAFVFDPAGAYRELYVQPGRVAGHVLRVGSVSVDLVALSGGDGVRLHLVPAAEATGANVSDGSCGLHGGEGAPT